MRLRLILADHAQWGEDEAVESLSQSWARVESKIETEVTASGSAATDAEVAPSASAE